ncbi:hypothetical protein SAMN04487968_101264 [Nocardioides terrae]|uniref:Hemerythrin HHE cation binding domain-containing protein n=1 Tax=Nocardioides terrae TaxID=574651 RepID=A0A1I1DHF3_9ACTN|nr:hypothetical protein [Nocardioides terrae]SFB74375.1 hypothetical protein SAMN04487968_101264 [Nocardioides terrae]
MSTKTACLIDYVGSTHDDLAARMETARHMQGTRDDPRLERHRIDDFLGGTSRHLHAIDDVMLPEYAKVPDGKALCHDLTASVKRLEVLLYHVNAHEYGSTIEGHYAWPELWADVEQALGDERRHEEELARRLTERLDDERLAELTGRIQRVEPQEPTRPHPHQPHGGMLGRVSRGVMRRTDAFWDMAQGRIVPEPEHEPKRKPGLLGQYLLGSPRMGQEDDRPE